MLKVMLVGVVGLFFVGCDTCPRVATVKRSDPQWARFEGQGAKNSCKTDADCVVGGCGGEICAAEPLVSTCEAPKNKPTGSCSCLLGQCQWAKVDCDVKMCPVLCAVGPCPLVPCPDPKPDAGGEIE